jgi:hypothetical protein
LDLFCGGPGVRLLTENYLDGRVSFTSTGSAGTTFELLGAALCGLGLLRRPRVR